MFTPILKNAASVPGSTRHCNQIADDYSAATFVGVRPASLHMFQTLGFKLLGLLKLNMADYGQPSEAYATLRQDPQLKNISI